MKHKAANFRWTHSSLLVSVAIMSFQTGETYCNLDLNEAKYNDNKPSTAEKEKKNQTYVQVPTFSVTENVCKQFDGENRVYNPK